jgi:hypothetical protein
MDVRKARKALKRIRKYPEQHDQDTWVEYKGERDSEEYPEGGEFACAKSNGDHPPCGTTLCMAGWVSFLEAPKGTVFNVNTFIFNPPGAEDAEVVNMADFAQDVLKLNDDQREVMFHFARDAEELELLINSIQKHPDSGGAGLMADLRKHRRARPPLSPWRELED